MRTHLPISVRPWLADMRCLPPKKQKPSRFHFVLRAATASQNVCVPFPRSWRPHDAMGPFNFSLLLKLLRRGSWESGTLHL